MIIDTHVHIGDMIGFRLTKEDVLYSMQKYGIDHSIVSNLNAAEFDHEIQPVPPRFLHSQTECLHEVVGFAKEYPTKISAAVWVRPFHETADKALCRAIEENRQYITAVKFHPYHSNVPFDSKKSEPFIEMAEHFGLPVVTHTGGSDTASCICVYRMAKKYSHTKFVMVHMGLGTDNSEAIELISQLPNLYGDTTWVPVKSTLQLIQKAGIDKIFFGSDNPIDGPDTYLHNRTGDRSLYQEYFHELKTMLSPEEYDKLMYKNAASVFNIPIPQ